MAAFGFMTFGAGTLASIGYGLYLRRWLVLLSAAVLFGMWLGLRAFGSYSDELWLNHFIATSTERIKFVEYMKSHSGPGEPARVMLPSGTNSPTAEPFAYSFRSGKGDRTFCYASFTHGIDNSIGFCWSESGEPPPSLAYPVITWTKALGNGWFMFRST
jgi:hypothetical protein